MHLFHCCVYHIPVSLSPAEKFNGLSDRYKNLTGDTGRLRGTNFYKFSDSATYWVLRGNPDCELALSHDQEQMRPFCMASDTFVTHVPDMRAITE